MIMGPDTPQAVGLIGSLVTRRDRVNYDYDNKLRLLFCFIVVALVFVSGLVRVLICSMSDVWSFCKLVLVVDSLFAFVFVLAVASVLTLVRALICLMSEFQFCARLVAFLIHSCSSTAVAASQSSRRQQQQRAPMWRECCHHTQTHHLKMTTLSHRRLPSRWDIRCVVGAPTM